ncbi:Pentatricopeptide repeat-containing protein [Camellia lanceoleosa]|uniref:Pentatricopeptide repeat-containing protein n=1 Tax=Camellia lanceoleosa TaxID=1840588 RepID=A0ACC0FTF5_9ERIC|nr:Pentatricopeptide repeat-containing protein [Camellia lanceoleosa]
MKVFRSNRALNLNRCCCGFGLGKALVYSTTSTASAPAKPRDSLYRRISPLGQPTASIVPVLDRWIEEGRNVSKEQLQHLVKELRRYSRFRHALEVSQWMSDKRYFELSFADIAVRLDLIAKVHGTEQAENYFNNISQKSKHMAYCTLLNCYAREKYVEKAEVIMQKMKELGLATAALSYNIMLNLYRQTKNHDKLHALIHEMEEKDIQYDKFTCSILLTAYTDTSNIEGMDKILQRMESDPKVVLDWNAYSVVANGFLKAGLTEKALAMLTKSECLILTTKRRRSMAFDYLVTQYAAIGKKDNVLRLWELHKKTEKIYNKSYISMITSLLKFDDIEGAEKIFEEWESSELSYDFRVPNFLIGAYCRKGLVEKAEAFINRAKMRGGNPLPLTWYFLATGYVKDNQIAKAVEAMKIAVSTCEPRLKVSKPTLAACLEYLKEKGDVEEVVEFLRLLLAKGVVSADIHEKLLNYMKNAKSFSQALSLMEEDDLAGAGETTKILEEKQMDAWVADGEIYGITELK